MMVSGGEPTSGAIVYNERNRLGAGGDVFRGSLSGFKVAVKIIRKSFVDKSQQLEAQLRRISHANVVRVFKTEDYDGFR